MRSQCGGGGGRKNKIIACTWHKSRRGAVGREKGKVGVGDSMERKEGGRRRGNGNNVWKWHNETHYLSYYSSKINQTKTHFSYPERVWFLKTIKTKI